MTTLHTVYFKDSRELSHIEDSTVDLVVTSPPYPMIEMWDRCFTEMIPAIGSALERGDGRGAFELMHVELNTVWKEVARVLKTGGIACINIGDATRTIGNKFRLYQNHAWVSSAMFELGLDSLPAILWRKQTNAPNKFMGSGMLPAGAYVTLEHEYILIFRKGGKRTFSRGEENFNRRRSALFWEERNMWYSDIWDFKGIRQVVSAAGGVRTRSGAFPAELAYRLISMYSVYGDTVLDPFLGTGTTMMAAASAGRNSVGVELDPGFVPMIDEAMTAVPLYSSDRVGNRLCTHRDFIEERRARKGDPKYTNRNYNFPVVTSQETDLELLEAAAVVHEGKGLYAVEYREP